MKKIDLFLFDLDGTLADTGRDIAAAVNYALGALNLRPLAPERILTYVGDGVGELIRRCLGPENEGIFDEVLFVFKEYYDRHLLDTTVLYPGVRESLAAFRNKRKAVLSNKGHHFVLKVLAGLGIRDFFDAVIGGDVFPYKKPDPRIVLPLLDRWGAPPDRTVMVGDGRNDILLAKETGILSCAFLNGLTRREDLLALGPDYTCEDMGELTRIFC
ncbi:MAG TPA: HAD-IA family hydrolase [Syntrophales bacterium]|nr:HAD-IA family hydrolase [Syntrophales bacterium]HOM06649.1 HAD-IA family hydrolase [Syntrophales bacterium]HON99799.1 HAD-IA family hydrolase [Syntrophales bacterium]HPC01153.1 HAD-IA family hydrolase [Syntrophales bacterium]HPQ06310.1 HAD-IA family hydrolase [Syntrophales bacterium]